VTVTVAITAIIVAVASKFSRILTSDASRLGLSTTKAHHNAVLQAQNTIDIGEGELRK
jgi:hypothetical protein